MFNVNCNIKEFQGVKNKIVDLDATVHISTSNKNFYKIRFELDNELVVWYYETLEQRDKQFKEVSDLFFKQD